MAQYTGVQAMRAAGAERMTLRLSDVASQLLTDVEAAKKAASTDPSPNKPNCPVNQGPISGNWCLHSANGPDNPGYVMQCEIPGVPKYQWPAAVNGKCD